MVDYKNIVDIPIVDGQSIHVSLQEYNKFGRDWCINEYYIPLGKYN